MRVEQFHPRPVKPAEGAQPPDKATETESQPPIGPHADQVALSRLSQILSAGLEENGRLEQLRAMVLAGTYQIPGAEVSQRLVDYHLTEKV